MSLPIQHVHAILDRSGSMNGKTDDVIGGFRSNIDNLREENDFEIMVSAKMFDNEEVIILPSINVKTLSEQKLNDALKLYIPRGQTALRDAVGNSLTFFINLFKMTPFHSCMIYVMTDGLENASKNPLFFPEKLKELIKKGEECNIKVFYVGSNQDAILNAANIGISEGQAINFDDTGEETVQAVFRGLSAVASRIRTDEKSEFTQSERADSVSQPY